MDEDGTFLRGKVVFPKKAGKIFLALFVVSTALAFILWMSGIGFQPVIRWIIFASGVAFGVAIICLIWGFILSQVSKSAGILRFWSSGSNMAYHTPKTTQRINTIVSSIIGVLCVAALIWMMPNLIEVSDVGAGLEYTRQNLLPFVFCGFLNALMGCVVGAIPSAMVALVWQARLIA